MKHLLNFLKTSSYLSILTLTIVLTACGQDSGSNSSGNTTSDTNISSSLSGSVGDGPIVGATVNIYDTQGTLVDSVISNDRANYSAHITMTADAYPLTIEVEGGTDLVTGLPPDFHMTSFVQQPLAKNININPFSTLIVEIARRMPAGITEDTIRTATAIVVDEMNFGLDPAIIADSITTKVTDDNVAVFVRSSEALGEMIRRTRDSLSGTGSVTSADDVVAAIADDIADGSLDGVGSGMSSHRIAAVSKLASAQVLIELLSNNLEVAGTVATDTIDNAIVTTHPTISPSELTDSIAVNHELLEQAREAIKVAQILSPSTDLDTIAVILDSLRTGSLASDIKRVLPAGSSAALDQPVMTAVAATDEQLNQAINGDSVTIPTDPPTSNKAPVLIGKPASTVAEDDRYQFQPSAMDAEGDTLSFSIQNRPGWATFSAATGRLSGTPENAHVGTYNNIVVTVSDGKLTDSVGPFSITVNNTNDAPTISGKAVTSATAGGFYSFQPSASDPDEDDLTFSITNRPSWASFNSSTGHLSGTPTHGDVSTYEGIVISASDGSVSRSLQPFRITVSASQPSNRAPVIGGAPANSVAEDSFYSFQPTSSDADGDNLSFSISNRPGWASFDTGSGRLSGTPDNNHVGLYKNILIIVSDGKASAGIGPFTITVSNTNDAPVISGVPASNIAEDSSYNFLPNASDPDGDNLSFSIQNRPGWASFNSTTGRLSGTPDNGDVGTYNNIKVTVSDGKISSSIGPFNIAVNNTNDAPIINGVPASTVDEGSHYSFTPQRL